MMDKNRMGGTLCWKCRGCIENEDIASGKEYEVHFRIQSKPDPNTVDKHIILCPSCYRMFREWINEGRWELI